MLALEMIEGAVVGHVGARTMTNIPQPRQILRKGNFPYKFKINEDYTYTDTGWSLTSEFRGKWLHISKNGFVTVKSNETGYAWDGCTPKWSLLNLVIIGVPDGHIDHRTMKPFTYHASLVHDALYQYLDTVPVSKEDIDKLFLKMLGDFKMRRLYYWAAKYFGGRGVKQRGMKQGTEAQLITEAASM